jgi:hypothetical protein
MAANLSPSRIGRALFLTNASISVSGTHFSKRLSKEQGLVRVEGLDQLMRIIHLIGSRTRDLQACRKVPTNCCNWCECRRMPVIRTFLLPFSDKTDVVTLHDCQDGCSVFVLLYYRLS